MKFAKVDFLAQLNLHFARYASAIRSTLFVKFWTNLIFCIERQNFEDYRADTVYFQGFYTFLNYLSCMDLHIISVV